MCPVNDDENVTRINQVHQLVRGDILYEFVDVPGVPDKEMAYKSFAVNGCRKN